MASIVCKVMGVVFIVVGIWGFITGHEVLIFRVNAAHNAVHLISGLTALACGFAGEASARVFSMVFGLVYGMVAILGFAGVQAVIDLLHLNNADNWLHAGIAIVFLAAGLIPKPIRMPVPA
jgi:hypothetical protein